VVIVPGEALVEEVMRGGFGWSPSFPLYFGDFGDFDFGVPFVSTVAGHTRRGPPVSSSVRGCDVTSSVTERERSHGFPSDVQAWVHKGFLVLLQGFRVF